MDSIASSKVFVVGKNQAKCFPVELVGSHDRYLDALFNRGEKSIRQLYEDVTNGDASATRNNIDDLVCRLRRHGVTDVLETNVICYSTPMSSDLRHSLHAGGAARGREIFQGLFNIIKPKILIAHGSGTVTELSKLFRIEFPNPPKSPSRPVEAKLGQTSVFVIRSLAPPEFGKWACGAINILTIFVGPWQRVWGEHLWAGKLAR